MKITTAAEMREIDPHHRQSVRRTLADPDGNAGNGVADSSSNIIPMRNASRSCAGRETTAAMDL